MSHNARPPDHTPARYTPSTTVATAHSVVPRAPSGISAWCTPLILPSGGAFIFDDNTTSILTARVMFKLPCDNPDPILSPDTTGNSTVIGFQEPFYASVSPQMYAIAAATVVSYVLVILIFITPRTFYLGGTGIGSGGRFLGRGTNSFGVGSIVGVGRRPLLQKIATITVAVSLTMASADTFSVAKQQYYQGYLDSDELVDQVTGSLEIRIVRIISDTFLWLAQVQTLIRLFPRHKEKVAIKWLGFALVSCDTVFSIVDSFVVENTRSRPRSFQNAISAMNYLFELAISLIYASCVVYYSLSKRRFAFYHPKMKNMFLVAVLSLTSVTIPVVFFVLDLSKPNIAGWGDYMRWVGAAAASVVVWEWVERIEALERDERKDGILGREIFDGDEMLEMAASEDGDWPGRGSRRPKGSNPVRRPAAAMVTRFRKFRTQLPLRKRRRTDDGGDGMSNGTAVILNPKSDGPTNQTTATTAAISPPSRSDTASAASTVYAIRYHNGISPSPGVPEDFRVIHDRIEEESVPKEVVDSSGSDMRPSDVDKERIVQRISGPDPNNPLANSATWNVWQAVVSNPFRRRRAEPPAEVAGAQIASGIRRSPIDHALNLRDRLGQFAITQKDRFSRRGSEAMATLPVTVIPLPLENGRTWSPQDARESSVHVVTQHNSTSTDQTMVANTSTVPAAQRSEDVDIVVVAAPAPGRTWSPGDSAFVRSGQSSLPGANSNTTTSIQPSSLQQQGMPPSSTRWDRGPGLSTTRGTVKFAEPLRSTGNGTQPISMPAIPHSRTEDPNTSSDADRDSEESVQILSSNSQPSSSSSNQQRRSPRSNPVTPPHHNHSDGPGIT